MGPKPIPMRPFWPPHLTPNTQTFELTGLINFCGSQWYFAYLGSISAVGGAMSVDAGCVHNLALRYAMGLHMRAAHSNLTRRTELRKVSFQSSLARAIDPSAPNRSISTG